MDKFILKRIDQTGSNLLLPGLGFRHEGTLAECEIVDQSYISLDIYAKLSTST